MSSPSSRFSPEKLRVLEKLLARQGIDPESQFSIPAVPDRGSAPLSYAQQRLWFLDLMQPGNPLYNVPVAVQLRGVLDLKALQQSLNYIIARHRVLRTRFERTQDGEPRQVVVPHLQLELPVGDVHGEREEEKWEEVRALAAEESQRGFDLSAGPPIRAQVLRISERDHVIFITLHHIVTDEWSQAILMKELTAAYSAFVQGSQPALPSLPFQYLDYASWQREWLQGELLERQLSYWKGQLSGCTEVIELPLDHPRPATAVHTGSRYSFDIESGLSRSLRRRAREADATLFMLLLTALRVLLWRYTGQRDVNIGTPVANRSPQETEALIGLFVNTLVMRTPINDFEPFQQLVKRTKETAVSAYAHQELPFEKLVQELQPERDSGHSPLFQVMFAFQAPMRTSVNVAKLELQPLEIERNSAKFDLTFFVEDGADELSGVVEYHSGILEKQTIKRMVAHWKQLLSASVARPSTPVWELPLLSPEEYRQIIFGWNETPQDNLSEGSILAAFEAQVRKTPTAVAVSLHNARQLSFAELNERSSQLAAYLISRHVAAEELVAICLERTPDVLVAMLGVLKAGAAYVPLDLSCPPERLQHIIEDADSRVVITTENLLSQLVLCPGTKICIDRDWDEIAAEHAPRLPSPSPENLAYVIYTSGSTGRPKGVMVTHRGLANYVFWSSRAYKVCEGNGAPAHTSISFDLSITSIYCPLLAGRPVVFMPEGSDPSALTGLLNTWENFSLVKLTPAHVEMLDYDFSRHGAEPPRALVIGGEALHFEALSVWRLHAPGTRLINEYGPTETVVGCSVYEVQGSDPYFGAVPIGRPIFATRMYVLDANLHPVPVGVVGEIYIGGAGVARGYWNRPDATAEKFIPDPFSAELGARLYKSGDVGKYRPDGTIEYLGRSDDQIKLRGFRVELGEIESHLAAFPGVSRVAIVVREDNPGDKRLVAYVVSEQPPSEMLDSDAILAHLRSKLPAYMIPSAVVELQELPLTSSGKVDRKALPWVQQSRLPARLLPRDELELKLTILWEELLNVAPIGRRDNFFSLGGHSFLAVALMNRIKERFGQELPVSVLFEEPTIEHLGDAIRHSYHPAERSNLVQIQSKGDGAPIFFVHAISGGALCYLPLARLLSDRPFYGLQAIDMEDQNRTAVLSIEERAALYLQAVRKARPHGPYLLGGWSFGGYVAFEMARQLRLQNEEVALLALLDIEGWIDIDDPAQRDDVELLLVTANDAIQNEEPSLVLSLSEIQKIAPEQRLPQLLDVMIKAKVLPPHVTVQHLQNYLRSYRERDASLRQYRLAPYDGSISLIRTTDRQPPAAKSGVDPEDDTLGWSAFSSSPIQVHLVPGSHYNMIYPPHVEHVANALNLQLSRIAGEGPLS
jgi:amino acid adenylation domain-containing protein